MALLAIDLGGTKLSSAVFTKDGLMQNRSYRLLEKRQGHEIGALIKEEVLNQLQTAAQGKQEIHAIGVSVPGISDQKKNTVWAPNLSGWEQYPLYNEILQVSNGILPIIESDRACYILGETWQGAAIGAEDAIFMAVGTGIGAGILANGHIIRGSNDIAGAIGWLALKPSYQEKYKNCGQFESYTSGEGIARLAQELLAEKKDYTGALKDLNELTAYTIFTAHEQRDEIAIAVINQCIEYWGMAIANLVSLFNPQKIILGGGVFGPAVAFIPSIYLEAKKWAQPISSTQFELLPSALGTDAGLYGAAYAALKKLHPLT